MLSNNMGAIISQGAARVKHTRREEKGDPMLEKAKGAKYVVPLVVVALAACLFGLVFYPMANMEMKNLPFAVLSLDEGAQTPQGEMNVGDTLVENMVSSADAEDAPIAWTVLDSQDELDEALENNEFYGALVVPEGYTAAQVAAQMAAAQADPSAAAPAATDVEAPTLEVIVDYAKSPLVAQQMQTSISSLFEQMGATVDVEVIHQGDATDDASASPMSGMMSQQVAIMPLCMAMMICSILVAVVLLPVRKAAKDKRWHAIGVQAAILVAASLVAALCAWCLVTLVAGMDAPAGPSILFFWMAALCVGLLLTGAFDIAVPLGALVALCLFGLGMATGAMPHEALPAFWQDWVVPWAPQNYIGQGVRSILYMGADAWNVGSGPLAITGIVGACLMAIAGFIPKPKEENAA